LAVPAGGRPARAPTTLEATSTRETVARGHGGYGGRAAPVGDGVEFVDQGPEPRSFADRA
jgi:hypothetical protein